MSKLIEKKEINEVTNPVDWAPKDLLFLATQTNLPYANISAWKIFEAASKNDSLMWNFLKKTEEWVYEVNFFNNVNAENNIGLADVMPENVKEVYINWEKNWVKYSVAWKRQWLKWWFYDSNGRYLPIFNWFKVQVLASYTEQELSEKKTANQESYSSIVKNPKLNDFTSKFPWELELIVKKWIEYWIDPNLLIALRKSENWKTWIDFWVMRAWIDTFEWQLTIACRIIQNNMNKYKRITKQDPVDWSTFTGEFIAFLSNIYAPIWANNDPTNLNKNHLKNLLNFYSDYSGKDFGDIELLIASSLQKSMEWNELANSDSILWKTNPEDLIKSAYKHIWKWYLFWWNWEENIDCSQLVIESLKDNWVVSQAFDTTAHNLSKFTRQKNPSDVIRWDLVFLQNWGNITHVEIALGPVIDWQIPIIDASSNVWIVSTRYQKLNQKVLVWTPVFYS